MREGQVERGRAHMATTGWQHLVEARDPAKAGQAAAADQSARLSPVRVRSAAAQADQINTRARAQTPPPATCTCGAPLECGPGRRAPIECGACKHERRSREQTIAMAHSPRELEQRGRLIVQLRDEVVPISEIASRVGLAPQLDQPHRHRTTPGRRSTARQQRWPRINRCKLPATPAMMGTPPGTSDAR